MLFYVLIRATLIGKNMLLMGSIFFPSIVTPLRCTVFLYVETYSTVQKLVFDNKDSNILRMCVHLLIIVKLNSKLYLAVSYFENSRQI